MIPLPVVAAEPLCRAGGRTCAACCWGESVSAATLRRRLRRQTRWFPRFVGSAGPAKGWLLLYELLVRHGTDLFWATLLLVPLLGDLLRPWLGRRTSCAYLGFEDDAETRVGCMLHPTRWGNRDVRQRLAFALLPGFACGKGDYFCLPAWRFARAAWHQRQQFIRQTDGMDWFAFSQAASALPVNGSRAISE
jgi:hypothetical protein